MSNALRFLNVLGLALVLGALPGCADDAGETTPAAYGDTSGGEGVARGEPVRVASAANVTPPAASETSPEATNAGGERAEAAPGGIYSPEPGEFRRAPRGQTMRMPADVGAPALETE
ncbi:MAG: hypothetical protein AAGH15_14170 [Myxococcota bacterium]